MIDHVRLSRWRTGVPLIAGALCLALGVVLTPDTHTLAGPAGAAVVPPCRRSQGMVVGTRIPPTSVTTIEQVYTCLLAQYPTGSMLDDRALLHDAMAALVTELARHGWDQATVVLPPLHGKPGPDWHAFQETYTRIAARLPDDSEVRARVAQAAINGLTGSLHDDHTRYAPPALDVGGVGGNSTGPAGQGDFGRGLRLSADPALPARTTAPIFIIAVNSGSPAARAGLRPGDVIAAIDGHAPFIGGVADQTVLAQLDGPSTIRVMVRRPADRRMFTVTLTPAPYPAPQPVSARGLPGNLAYVRLADFVDNAANFVVAAVDGLGLGRHLRGVVLDLRGNGGGSAAEPGRLLGAFTHHAIFAYAEDGHGRQTAVWTDTTMPLLGVPVVVLIDRGCASACDITAAAIHDLHLGRLIGERTAGDAAGPADPWFLDDGGVLQIPASFTRGADGEIVDGIGVPPDEEVPVTPAALSAGRDPVLERAIQDLHG